MGSLGPTLFSHTLSPNFHLPTLAVVLVHLDMLITEWPFGNLVFIIIILMVVNYN